MGKIERDGIGGPKNAKAAAHWFLRAAEQGYAKAQNHIANATASTRSSCSR